MTGINVDPLNPNNAPSPDQVKAAGFTWVRLVSRPGVEQYVSDMQSSGIMVLAICTAQSNGYVWGGPDIWQFGNEPDVLGTADTMAPNVYQQQFVFYQQTYPNLIWIGAGLGNGQTNYWQSVQSAGGLIGAAGFDVHPYAKNASQARNLLAAYQRITPNLPMWVTEFNRPTTEIAGFAQMLRQNTCMHAWYAWGGQDDPQFNSTDTQRRILAA